MHLLNVTLCSGEDIPERLLKNKVRRYVQDPGAIKTKVTSLITKYRDVPGLFKKSIDDTHTNAMVDLDLGYICDEEKIALYTNIGTPDSPRCVSAFERLSSNDAVDT